MYRVGGFALDVSGLRHAATPPLAQPGVLHVLKEPVKTGWVVAWVFVLTLTTVANANGRIFSAVLAARDCTKTFARSNAVMKCVPPRFPGPGPSFADLG